MPVTADEGTAQVRVYASDARRGAEYAGALRLAQRDVYRALWALLDLATPEQRAAVGLQPIVVT